MSDEERLSSVESLLDREPSASSWRDICEHLTAMKDQTAIDLGLLAAREHNLIRWPARLRHAESVSDLPSAPWLAKLFHGVCDPRLGIVGWASMRHEVEHRLHEDPILGDRNSDLEGPGFTTLVRPIVLAFARHLQPDFTPPDVLISREDNVMSAYGCGGGFELETWGDATRGIRWHAVVTEHAADYSSDGAWTVYGLNEGMTIKVGDKERGSGTYSFEVAGPTPKVLELALAWGALLRIGRRWTLEQAVACLAGAHVSF